MTDNERIVTETRRLRTQLKEAAAVLEESSPAEEGTAEERGWLVVPDANAA